MRTLSYQEQEAHFLYVYKKGDDIHISSLALTNLFS